MSTAQTNHRMDQTPLALSRRYLTPRPALGHISRFRAPTEEMRLIRCPERVS